MEFQNTDIKQVDKGTALVKDNVFHGFTHAAFGNQVYLDRPRVNDLLEQAVQKPVVCVTAGAGYGKTSAVYKFSKMCNADTIWIQLSARDNMRERFWENFLYVISIINREAAAAFHEIGFPASEQQFQYFLSLCREAAVPNKKYLLVYDDAHLIAEKSVLDFLKRFIAVMLPNTCFVLISRTECALDLDIENLDSKKILATITEDDLRFRYDEMLAYFKLADVQVDSALASSLYHDTEGWAFSIHLASLSLKNLPRAESSYPANVPRFLKSSAAQLIENEIMPTVSPELRQLLIKMSLGEIFAPSLVLTIAKDSAVVKQLETLSSFIRFDSYANVYHIHHFFLEYLRGKQNELTDEEKKEVWALAAQWCLENNRKMDAIINYEKSCDYEGIVTTLNTLPLIFSAEMAAFALSIFDRAPESIYRNCPGTAVVRNRSLVSLGRFQQSRAETLAIIPVIKSLASSPSNHSILSACYINIGFIDLFESLRTRKYDFVDFFKEAAFEREKSGIVTEPPLNGAVLRSHVCEVSYPASEADINQFIEVIDQIVPYTVRAVGGCMSGLDDLCRGELSFFQGKLDEAQTHSTMSLGKARKYRQYEIENRALFYLLRIYVSRGDTKNIENVLMQLEAELSETLYINRRFYHDIVTAWYYIQTGQNERVALWLKSDFKESNLNSRVQGLEKLVKAKYYASEKRYHVALAILESCSGIEPLIMANVEIKALQALCHYRTMDKPLAFKMLAEAYELASPAALYMPFIELGKDMRAFAETALRDQAAGIPESWLVDIKRRSALYAKKLYPQIQKHSRGKTVLLARSLSHRETSVLSGLSQGLTGIEIAEASCISHNTVKSAVKSIYYKLGALNKADAIRIASEKGILNHLSAGTKAKASGA